MIRRVLVTIAAMALLPVLLAASASASAPSTAVSMTYMNAANTAPMAGAHVVVYYVRPARTCIPASRCRNLRWEQPTPAES